MMREKQESTVCYYPLKTITEMSFELELRQYKNESILSKIIPILKLPRFFPRRIADEKER